MEDINNFYAVKILQRVAHVDEIDGVRLNHREGADVVPVVDMGIVGQIDVDKTGNVALVTTQVQIHVCADGGYR
jgi:hypothetical protein